MADRNEEGYAEGPLAPHGRPLPPFGDFAKLAELLDPSPAEMARLLGGHPDYRVLRRMPPEEELVFAEPGVADDLQGVYLDVETTGLLAVQDEVIELALVPFTFRVNVPEGQGARITSVGRAAVQLNQPTRGPIPPEVVELTGITDEMVRGHAIIPEFVAEYLTDCALVLAHNARFDRPFAERLLPAFAKLPWGCTIEDGPWRERGIRYANLPHLLAERRGEFFDGHRGAIDCHAGLRLLVGQGEPRDYTLDDGAFAELLHSIKVGRYRVWAHGAPRALNDQLKARGYRWDGDGRRAWYRNVRTRQESGAECEWLYAQYPQADWMVAVDRVSAYHRFSERA